MFLQGRVELNWDRMEETDVSMEIREISLDQEKQLPLSHKIDDLSTKIQV